LAGLLSRRGQPASFSDRGGGSEFRILDPLKPNAAIGLSLPDFAEGLSFLGKKSNELSNPGMAKCHPAREC
jgi:hypothetical protein